MGTSLTTCTINVIDAAELIYDHLFSDPTIGDIFHMTNLRHFINLVYEAGFGSQLLIDVICRKPVKYTRMIESVVHSLKRMTEAYKEDAAFIKMYCYDLLRTLAAHSGQIPVNFSRLHLSVVA